MTKNEMRRQLVAAIRQVDSELPDWAFISMACIAVYKSAQVHEANVILQKRPEIQIHVDEDDGKGSD